jgi:hypothetical protein
MIPDTCHARAVSAMRQPHHTGEDSVMNNVTQGDLRPMHDIMHFLSVWFLGWSAGNSSPTRRNLQLIAYHHFNNHGRVDNSNPS